MTFSEPILMSTALNRLGAKAFTSPTHDVLTTSSLTKGIGSESRNVHSTCLSNLCFIRPLILSHVLAKSTYVKPSLGTSKLIFP